MLSKRRTMPIAVKGAKSIDSLAWPVVRRCALPPAKPFLNKTASALPRVNFHPCGRI